jgi:predicted Zn-dependent peptidase
MYKLEKLKNGLPVLLAPTKGAGTITIMLAVGTGSKYETRELNGISHFLEHMMFKGTKKHQTPLALSSAMDALGAEFNAFTGKEMTAYYIKVDSRKAVEAGEALAEMLINSKFNQAEFERERGVIIEEINMYEDNPMMYVEDVFEMCIYGDTPAGWDTAGPKENISAMKHSALVDYFRRQYQLANSFLIVAGDTGKLDAAKLESLFGQFGAKHRPAEFREKLPVMIEQAAARIKLKYKKTDQAHLSLGVPAFPSGHPQEIAAKFLAIILGGSMSSRLFTELREKRGLAYYVHTQVEGSSDSGYLTTQAGVPVAKVEESLVTILAEYRKLTKKLVTEKELKLVKDMLNGKLALKLEASDEVANWYARQAIMNLTQAREQGAGRKIITPEEYLRAINKITAHDLRVLAREIFVQERFNLAIIGPYEKVEEFKKILKF